MSSSSASGSTRGRDSGNTPDYLYQVKLLTALRSGDPTVIHPFLADISSRKSSEGDTDVGAAALHLAIRCASCDTVSLLLSHRSISPNSVYPPGSGTTALHLAASIARTDVVNLLLEQDNIDDSARDGNCRTCLEVAKGKDTVRAIQDSRSLLNASYRSLLRTYILSVPTASPPSALLKLVSSPRIHLVNLSYIDDASGRTLLHEAARRKDLRLVELAIRGGADVFVRDRKGRAVGDGVGKDDRVRVFLRQFTNQDTTLINVPSSEPPELKGYLNKYTNVAKGYNTRWFVLKDGVLSYYRHQEDENVACRGSIAMKTAVLHVTQGSSGPRFEVHATPARGHQGAQKWYLKANHPVEASRWNQALRRSIELARRDADGDRGSADSEALSYKPPSTIGSFVGSYFPRKRPGVNGTRSRASSLAGDDIGDANNLAREGSGRAPSDDQEGEQTSFAESTEKLPPHSASFELQGNAVEAQVDLTSKLLANLPLPSNMPPQVTEARRAVEDTFGILQGMFSEYVQMVRDREEWWKVKLERERERQAIWEESLQVVVREGDAMERELRSKSRRRSRTIDASFASTGQDSGTVKKRLSRLASPTEAEAVTTPTEGPLAASTDLTVSPRMPSAAQITTGAGVWPLSLSPVAMDTESFADTDEEDEFFDAIETNTLPNLIVTQSLTAPSHGFFITRNREQYLGYEYLRKRLAISSDNRPPMSLWAVLKNSIGKDLTKISFPVFFNEPTSMLQRMAEDMEFSECLDAACAESDPQRRIAFVAAFAMSNYSSTIGRIAKPFNPMLGETFEYVRFDKDYRYMSEQVSHHPPISACWAESPSWHYYGEVDAQNKFMGKSFEIRPTGVAHAELLLPEAQAPHYPKAKAPHLAGKVVEHYSWKKVTTNVSGFILGSPTIDHYGDMIVTNHRTQDQCLLTFKPRGWRGKDAYEISGYVMDSDGTVTYEIAGRWNSQLVARAVGTGIGQLHPDVPVAVPTSPSPTAEYILLWRNSVKPPAPFNLTPFAITLNDCPDTLKPFVSPTDCRLRPDQRAFELGNYEHANNLKNKQEDLQRVTRRARDEGRLPPHRPRWFTKRIEPDTHERIWAPSTIDYRLEYWLEREKIWQARKSGTEAVWKDVDRIFIDDDPNGDS
ncbi:hypothetical protein SCP_0116570 [Sparassis crispa]|uniref:PH domain-containing protein n=1 Tax=Sparassis crispa TaxID=139825 RepID=A0A401G9C3_9APHY|nr:hypothetical protein SCP_0116570 [Sparassis crispa]GBE78765.1 hypothetical protein SCP_0116570 [Sparassis crispa]